MVSLKEDRESEEFFISFLVGRDIGAVVFICFK